MTFLTTKHLYFIICILLTGALWAQTPAEEFDGLRKKYPDENAVTTNKWRRITIEVVGDSLEIVQEDYQEVLILNNPLQNSKDRVYSSSLTEVFEIEAYTLIPGKKKYKEVEVEDFKRSFDKDSYVFYDDTEWINFNYPQIANGAKVVKRFKRKISDPHIIGQFFLASYRPVVQAQLEVVAKAGVSLNLGIFKEDLLDIKYTKEQLPDGGEKHSFTDTDIEAIPYESDGPDFTYLTPSVYVTIADFTNSKGEKQAILGSLDDLHSWYSGFLKDLSIDEGVSTLAQEIVAATDSDLEKVRKIFYWVQNNVKYIAFEQGMRGFIPHPAAYVMNKRYGDCKDMSSLLVGLLRSVDVDANFTWIGSRNLPYSYLEIPSPIVDDHMIASVLINGERVFLDATGNYTPLGFPTSMIQEKESLVNTGESYTIAKVPAIAKERNQMVDTSRVWIKDGSIFGKGKTYLSGLVKVANTHKMIKKSQKSQDDYVLRLLSRGSNKFFLDTHEISNLEDLDVPIEVDHEFRVEDYYKEIGEQLYVNLCLDKSLINDLIKDREVPRENDYKYITRYVTDFEIPEDYEASSIPDDSSGDFGPFGYSITYEKNDNNVMVSQQFYVDYLLLGIDQFDQWNEGIKEYSAALRNALVLVKK